MKGLTDPRLYKDKYVQHFHPVFKDFRRRNVRPMVTREIIAEHAANPLGLRPDFHSLQLQYVLAYFRTISEEAMYLPIELPNNWGFSIVAAAQGRPPKVLCEEIYPTVDAARHAIFLKRVAELEVENVEEEADV
ncbi:hypothetical protein EOA13_36230 [Mesorhizobium sp. M7A.F.Ca.US.011.01.1.1]|uniref:hypothetical protein n=1 Tax=Mesorhizobium sp. M7A.F.Ca.US.011.01.1.1 TaxID=2496741 RepID=UPI000FCB6AA5|nr:hypothetical protein [Mesorhizobium sp. M7A.F.Ca.US.011.01.1.1]RUX22297.1 hypothetical protein EOA13_36230 [Mesorhizobium sp. M7A.F.Ca.US.011.01.1.1]